MLVILIKATQGGFMSPCSVFFFSMLRDEFIFFNGGEVHQPSYDQLRQHIKKQSHYFVNKGLSS